MRTYVKQCETSIPAPRNEVFEFFADAKNLESLTPPTLSFKIVTPLPIEMRAGAHIQYRIRLLGVAFGWLTEITVWEPESRFVDVQLKGPYQKWEHEHAFFDEGDSTRMTDTVHYAVPGFFLAPLIHKLFVFGQVEKIFEYRELAIRQQFPSKTR
jgi:ligand-binding SRPBCC domain-containing protein